MQIPVTPDRSSRYSRFGSYLHGQHFGIMVALAIVLHMGAIGIYQLLPREIVQEIPVRVLNIKIGKNLSAPAAEKEVAEKPEEAPTPKPAPARVEKPKPKPKAPPKKPVSKPAKPVVKAKPNPIIKEQVAKRVTISDAARAKAKQESSQTRKYVREDAIRNVVVSGNTGKAQAGEGSVYGNSTSVSAEIEKRYTQTLSLWFNRFKVYPIEARRAGIGGTVMLRIRIDRQGSILRYYLEHPSGYKIIDQAISTMVNAANPVPAVPLNYPDSRPFLEFLVPIHFKP